MPGVFERQVPWVETGGGESGAVSVRDFTGELTDIYRI